MPVQLESAQTCIKNVLFVASCLGVFPVSKIRHSQPEKLYFSWKSWRTLFAVCFLVAFLVSGMFAFYKAFTVGSFINQLISPLFYINSFMLMVFLIKVSKHWKPFMVSLCKLEELINKKYGKPQKLRRKVNIVTAVIFFVAFVEHGLSTLNYIYSTSCQNEFYGLEYYLRKQFHYIFYYFGYNLIAGIFLLILCWIGAFVWNFGDTIIIVMSLIVASRFRQISTYLKKYVDKTFYPDLPEKGKVIKLYNSNLSIQTKIDNLFWRELREDYNKLDKICKRLDALLSDLVMLSYSCNLTFILAQLFNSLRQMDSVIERFYFFYSFGFVIIRTVAVSIYGAYIYEECKAFIPILNSVPTENFNQEIQRLVLQIHIDPAALTGHNFFQITRGLVLNVAAAIITYELVLIQFNQATLEKYKSQINDTICF